MNEINYIYQWMDWLRKNCTTLQLLHRSNPALRKAIIAKANPQLIKTICDCSLNILKGNIKLSEKSRKRLAQHKTKLRKLADTKVTLKQKQCVIQKGGFLDTLLFTVLLVVTSLIGGLVSQQ